MISRFFQIGCVLVLMSCTTGQTTHVTSVAPEPRLFYPYEHSSGCRSCHDHIYRQYETSEHAQAFTNPLFQAQYFKEVVPRALREPAFRKEARRCIACHAPVVFMNNTGLLQTAAETRALETGVSCDFCHTLAGYLPNGDYQQNRSGKKQGPLMVNNHHSEYSGWYEISEFCGPCHNASNQQGVPVKATFSEWKASSFAAERITCQECHMSRQGFLKDRHGEYEKGAAAHLNFIGFGDRNMARSDYAKLYSHNFPGAHNNTQLEGAIRLEIRGEGRLDAGGRMPFSIAVNNQRAGHRMPSGSSDLRFMWLQVSVSDSSGRPVPFRLAADSPGNPDYGVSGRAPNDRTLLGPHIPDATRLYRAVFNNHSGVPVHSFYDAASLAFDNRLNAGEVRDEPYLIETTAGFKGPFLISAQLFYQSAPASFTARLGLPGVAPVAVATAARTVPPAPSAQP